MKTVNIGLLIGIAVIAMVGLMLFATLGTSTGLTKYTSFAEAKKTGEEVHIVGNWVMPDRANYDNSQDLFSFYLQDTTGATSLVHYFDPMPGNFKSAKRIAVEGKYEGNTFVADRILMKCPSKYGDDKPMELNAAAAR